MDLAQFTSNGKFLMLALDHRGSFKKLINPQDPDVVSDEQVIELKSEIIQALENQFSGLLIDEVWGLEAYRDRAKPFLLPLEKSGYEEVNGERVTKLEYSVEQIKNLGASGAKLLLYFNPNVPSAQRQLETAKKVIEDCQAADFPYFLEIVTYTPDVSLQSHIGSGSLVVESVKMFLDQGIVPDVWKLEYPGSPEECEKLTELVGETPWILLTGGQTFEQFKPELEVVIRGGAKGFLAGRALWQEVCKLSSEEKQKFLNEVLPVRFRELAEIAISY